MSYILLATKRKYQYIEKGLGYQTDIKENVWKFVLNISDTGMIYSRKFAMKDLRTVL